MAKEEENINYKENYLNDITYSIYVDNNKNVLDDSFLKDNRKWVDDDSVKSCYNCSSPFATFLRKHHCRMCGRIFCNECSNFRDIIPEQLLSNDSKKGTWNDYFISLVTSAENTKHRVCLQCHEIIMKIDSVKKKIKAFEVMGLTIHELKKAGSVCTTWSDASNYCILKFREVIYRLPNYSYTINDIRMLWKNYILLAGHSCYLVHLLKICNTDEEVKKVVEILELERQVSCEYLKCSKSCKEKLTSFDAINILSKCFESIEGYDMLKKVALSHLICGDEEFKCYIPYLVYYIRYDNGGVLSEFLIKRCFRNFDLFNSLYWELQTYLENDYHEKNYSTMLDDLKKMVSNDKQRGKFIRLLQGNSFIKIVENISDEIFEKKLKYDDIKDKYVLKNPMTIPITPSIKAKKILINKMKMKNSATKPIIIPCITDENKLYKLMYKKENLRKDQMIMGIITLVDLIMKSDEDIDLGIVKYNILPTGKKSGLIEIIEDSDTVYFVNEKIKSSILNYIMENNPNLKIKDLRDRFIKSTAVYCVITYLLGVGDRHLDNIMVTKDGRLFHIDFGYILGKDPIFSNPGIRITHEIIEAIGGLSSKYYIQFKDLCTKIYNCLRRNINIFINLLSLLPKISDIKLTEKEIVDQIIMRFKPGENEIDAKLHLVNKLENRDYTDKIKDWCHYHSKEKTISSAISRLATAVSGLWR